MDLAQSLLDGMDTGGPIVLPANLSTVMAEDLRVRLVFAADHDEAIILDAEATESIGQACLQLLIAAKREAERLELPFALEKLGDAVAARLTSLGLIDALGLRGNSDLQTEEQA